MKKIRELSGYTHTYPVSGSESVRLLAYETKDVKSVTKEMLKEASLGSISIEDIVEEAVVKKASTKEGGK